MQLDIVVAFFILGALARAVKSNLQLPPALYQSLTIFLLIAIGLKGGTALSQHASPILLPQSLAVITLGIAIPLIAFPLLFRFGQLNRTDSASIAAHYGSVSVATYAVAVAVLESRGMPYEAYFPLFVVLSISSFLYPSFQKLSMFDRIYCILCCNFTLKSWFSMGVKDILTDCEIGLSSGSATGVATKLRSSTVVGLFLVSN